MNIPWSWLFLLGIFLLLFLLSSIVYPPLLPVLSKQPPSFAKPQESSTLPTSNQRFLQLHLSGKGKERTWKPDEIQRIDYVQLLKYHSTFNRPSRSDSSSSFTEQRTIQRLRIVTLATSLHTKEIDVPIQTSRQEFEKWANLHDLKQFTSRSLPVLTISPSGMPRSMRNQFITSFRPSGEEQSPSRIRGIIYTSALEGETITLKHFPKTDTPAKIISSPKIPWFEKEIIRKSPIRPIDFVRKYSYYDPRQETIHVDGQSLQPYLQPVLDSRVEGTISFQSSREPKHLRLSGSGAINLYRNATEKQIGEVSLKNIHLDIDSNVQQIKNMDLNGFVTLRQLQKNEFLRRIQFLSPPSFSLNYSATSLDSNRSK